MRSLALVLAILMSCVSFPSLAQEPADCLEPPTDKVILEITGSIACGNHRNGPDLLARFDAAMLDSLELQVLETTTDWTNGRQRFEGPLMRDILELVKASGKEIYAVAANDYVVAIPREDFDDYGVVLAMRQNGKRLSLRDRGPLWIVYPRDAHPELRTPIMNTRWIWQLKSLDVR